MRYILILIAWLVLFSCRENPTKENKLDSNTRDSVSESPHELTDSTISKVEKVEWFFDIQRYKGKADSLVSQLSGIQTSSKISVETIQSGRSLFVELRDTPIENLSEYARLITKSRLSYRLGASGNAFTHDILVLAFHSTETADSVFTLFSNLAVINSGVPGITYTNDYITKVENTLFWLNSKCLTSYSNHRKLSELLKTEIEMEINKEILCKCGKVLCEVKSLSP